MINIAPRYGKSEWVIHLIAYGLAYFPHSRFMYISKDSDLAIRHCKYIEQIVKLPEFQRIYGISWASSKSQPASFLFTTDAGGEVYAVGAGGGITGRGAGIQGVDHFSGFAIIDDIHKIEEVHSPAVRERIATWYAETFLFRLNNPRKTPVITIGQITQEDDLLMRLRAGKHDPYPYHNIVLESMDAAGNALYPEMHTAEEHRAMEKANKYAWWAQHQQRPQPAGGAIFMEENFRILDEIPDNILATFVTVDTAETSKTHNDATVFSFWALYKIKQNGIETDQYALAWLNCWELRVEPKDLENEFMQFYYQCLMFHVKPVCIGVEKKSTGTTLLSVLQKLPGILVVDTIPHRKQSKSSAIVQNLDYNLQETIKHSNKIDRFLACQPIVATGRISFIKNADHNELCIKHLTKITASDKHMHDDIADTMSDAVFMGLLNNFIIDLVPQKMVGKPQAIKGYKGTMRRAK